MLSSNVLLFKELYEETRNVTMQPVVLVTLVILQGHLDKIVMQPGEENLIKEIDKELPE